MKPYYERGGIVLYHGDAREVLPSVAQCDLLLTDPPYGIAYRSNARNSMGAFAPIAGDNDPAAMVGVLAMALQSIRPFGHVYIFGPLDLSALRLGGRMELIWDKEIVGQGDLSLPWGLSHERITFGVHVKSEKNRAEGRGNGAARQRRASVLRFQRQHSAQNALHPTEKPVRLLRELIESSSHIGDVVLDPFVGVGSTLVAAQCECRRAIGIEIDERYCEIAARRLQQGVLPLEPAEAR